MKIYISGKITGLDNYEELFNSKKAELEALGHAVIIPLGFICNSYEEYMFEDFKLQKECDTTYFLRNHTDSYGAKMEEINAKRLGHVLLYEVPTTLESIAFMVSYHEGITLEDLRCKSQSYELADVRKIYYNLVWRTQKYSRNAAADFINKTHGSASYSLQESFKRKDIQERIKKYL